MPTLIALVVFGTIAYVCPNMFKYMILGPLFGFMFGGMAWGVSFAFVSNVDTVRSLFSFQTFLCFVIVATLMIDGLIFIESTKK